MEEMDAALEPLVDAFHRMQVQHARVLQHIAVRYALNPTDVRVLKYLGARTAQESAATPGAVGDYLQMSRGAVTALLDRLEARALVARRPNPEDRRGLLLEVSPAGRAVVADLRAAYATALEAGVPECSRREVIEACEALQVQLGALVAEPGASRGGG